MKRKREGLVVVNVEYSFKPTFPEIMKLMARPILPEESIRELDEDGYEVMPLADMISIVENANLNLSGSTDDGVWLVCS